MTTFDKLKGAAATLADAAVKTTGDLAQKGKKQMDLLALENKLSRAQRQLGALVYALHKNGEENTALVERYIETIAAVEKDIAALEPAPAAAMADEGKTPMFVTADGKLEGLICVADTIKEGSAEAVEKMKSLGIQVYMLT